MELRNYRLYPSDWEHPAQVLYLTAMDLAAPGQMEQATMDGIRRELTAKHAVSSQRVEGIGPALLNAGRR
jgi:hypothetical protein